jgi:hypothetical protein
LQLGLSGRARPACLSPAQINFKVTTKRTSDKPPGSFDWSEFKVSWGTPNPVALVKAGMDI